MKQQEILNALADRPYEIVLERKALGRILHNLANSNLGIRTDAKLSAVGLSNNLCCIAEYRLNAAITNMNI